MISLENLQNSEFLGYLFLVLDIECSGAVMKNKLMVAKSEERGSAKTSHGQEFNR